MEGFGSANTETYNYGSVDDGFVQNPTIEQRFRRKYWQTKQTVRTKLKKDEDEHVVAGDADIDAKLEKARHLESSCQKLLHALGSCNFYTRGLSTNEIMLGDYLISNGENDFTHAGDVMKRVGKVHDHNAKIRLTTTEPLYRLQQEFNTFYNTAIQDLSESIKRLEKARADYRASLLWMKNVSQKFKNPDAKEQLAKFREAQATVKESKEHFEKMKHCLIEKINMVAASRCNLLSHTLPYYQKELLTYLDRSADELHKLLATLRSQTQHQYKLNFLSEEVHGLEAGEIPSQANQISSENQTIKPVESIKDDDDDLFDMLQRESSIPAVSQRKHEDELIGGEDKAEQAHDLLTQEWDQFSSIEPSKPQPSEEDDQSLSKDDWTDDLVLAEQPSYNLSAELDNLLILDKQNISTTSSDTMFDLLLSSNNQTPTIPPLEKIYHPQIQTPLLPVTDVPPQTQTPLLPVTDVPPQTQTPLLPLTDVPPQTQTPLLPVTDVPPQTQTPLLPVTDVPPQTQTPLLPRTEVQSFNNQTPQLPMMFTQGSPLQPISLINQPSNIISTSAAGRSTLTPSTHLTSSQEHAGYKHGSKKELDSYQKWANLFAHLDPIANEKA